MSVSERRWWRRRAHFGLTLVWIIAPQKQFGFSLLFRGLAITFGLFPLQSGTSANHHQSSLEIFAEDNQTAFDLKFGEIWRLQFLGCGSRAAGLTPGNFGVLSTRLVSTRTECVPPQHLFLTQGKMNLPLPRCWCAANTPLFSKKFEDLQHQGDSWLSRAWTLAFTTHAPLFAHALTFPGIRRASPRLCRSA